VTLISFKCDRCGNRVDGMHTEQGTSGFYNVSEGHTWHSYALNDLEHFVCDPCVQGMELYQSTYGITAAK
jgi:hypothetical protein